MPSAFSGFRADDLAFLSGLAAHNDRAWFEANRRAYDEGLKPALAALVDATSAAMAARGLPLAGDAKRSLFRIHRDVRFSHDKRPYKTHVSATLTRDGAKMSPGMVYVHIEPEGGSAAAARAAAPVVDPERIDPLDPTTHPAARDGEAEGPFGHGAFLGVGFYLAERSDIDAFRRGVAADPGGWAKVERTLVKAGAPLGDGHPTKRLPKGFEAHAGTPLEPQLKRTRWLVSRPLTGAEIASPTLPEIIAAFTASARPLLAFGWRAMDAR